MLTLCSLFDGSGGFPLAGSLCGIEPVCAAEIEPYPIAVTTSRFPLMEHLGSVTEISGAEIEPVDIITFGSPCQDLSVAGKRAGLKHEDNGDDETTRSGLFMEAVRIIKEMREKTNGEYPKYAIWENVPGAFSSNKGEDFRVVLEELIKIVEPTAKMPPCGKNGWPYADCYMGTGWSLAYRTFDAQHWGVPQRRRRIYLILDLRGESAQKVLFEREGLRGYLAEGRTPREGSAGDAENCAGATDREGVSFGVTTKGNGDAFISAERHTALSAGGGHIYEGVSGTLRANAGDNQMAIAFKTYQKVSGPLMANSHPGSYTGQDAFNDMLVAGVDCRNMNEYPELYPTLQAKPNGGQSLNFSGAVRIRYITRRLTPTECARLQGFPDRWGDIDSKEDFTDGEYRFWLDVRNTHATVIGGREAKDYTKQQMLTWYNKLHTDSAEYKMWGNGIALPCALYVMQGIAEAEARR